MSFIEFFGFLISISAVIFLALRHTWEEWQRKKYPEKYALDKEKQGDVLKDFLKSLDVDLEDDAPPAPKPIPKIPKAVVKTPSVAKVRVQLPKKIKQSLLDEEFSYQTSLDQYKQITQIENRKLKTSIGDDAKKFAYDRVGSADLRVKRDAYSLIQKVEEPARGRKVLSRFKYSADMFIIQTILNPPKGL